MSTRWAEKYVGLPFVDGGRGWAGVDCWGLVRLVFKTEAGIDLPTYGEISARQLVEVSSKIEADSSVEPWVPVSLYRKLDVAVMIGRPLHVGVLVDPQRVLHVEQHTCTVMLSLDHETIRRRLLRVHRHRAMMDIAA